VRRTALLANITAYAADFAVRPDFLPPVGGMARHADLRIIRDKPDYIPGAGGDAHAAGGAFFVVDVCDPVLHFDGAELADSGAAPVPQAPELTAFRASARQSRGHVAIVKPLIVIPEIGDVVITGAADESGEAGHGLRLDAEYFRHFRDAFVAADGAGVYERMVRDDVLRELRAPRIAAAAAVRPGQGVANGREDRVLRHVENFPHPTEDKAENDTEPADYKDGKNNYIYSRQILHLLKDYFNNETNEKHEKIILPSVIFLFLGMNQNLQAKLIPLMLGCKFLYGFYFNYYFIVKIKSGIYNRFNGSYYSLHLKFNELFYLHDIGVAWVVEVGVTAGTAAQVAELLSEEGLRHAGKRFRVAPAFRTAGIRMAPTAYRKVAYDEVVQVLFPDEILEIFIPVIRVDADAEVSVPKPHIQYAFPFMVALPRIRGRPCGVHFTHAQVSDEILRKPTFIAGKDFGDHIVYFGFSYLLLLIN